jgi:hypothetical protein
VDYDGVAQEALILAVTSGLNKINKANAMAVGLIKPICRQSHLVQNGKSGLRFADLQSMVHQSLF